MLLHRLRTLAAYLLGMLFCLWAFIFCRSFKAAGWPRCYSWPVLRAADGELSIGRRVHLGRVKIILANGGRLALGDGVSVNDGSILGALSGITIGNNTSIAENVMVRDHDHDYFRAGIGDASQGYKVEKVTIGKGCWLGFGCAVLKGVNIDDGAIIGAGSVVTKDITRGCVVAGNPAKTIRVRNG